MMTYAYYIPPDYSRERFEKGQLDYARSTVVKGSPIEIWGLAVNVRKGMDVHNNVLREFAKTDGVFFVDQQALLGNHAENFFIFGRDEGDVEFFFNHALQDIRQGRVFLKVS